MCLQMLARLTHPSQDHHRRLQFVYYLQYQLHRQLLAVSNYAEAHRVALKGDLPIGESAQQEPLSPLLPNEGVPRTESATSARLVKEARPERDSARVDPCRGPRMPGWSCPGSWLQSPTLTLE